MLAINLLKNSVLLFSVGLIGLHSHGTCTPWPAENLGGPGPTETIIPTTSIPPPQQRQQRQDQDVHNGNNNNLGYGKGGNAQRQQQPSGLTTVVVVISRPANPHPPTSPNHLPVPSPPAKPTSAAVPVPARQDLRRGEKNPILLPVRRQDIPAAPPVDSNVDADADVPQQVPPPSSPMITPAPSLPPGPEYITDPGAMKAGVATYEGIDANGDAFRFVQTTYYSCVTRGTSAHCGWHRPIVDVVYGSGAGRGTGAAARAVGIAFLVVVGGMLLVWW